MNCMVSYIAIPAETIPPGLLMYNSICRKEEEEEEEEEEYRGGAAGSGRPEAHAQRGG